MKIKFLGTGSAFCLKNFQTNFIIEKNNKKLLVDAGGDIRFALNENNLNYKDIDSLYLSHSHTDHIGGVEYLAFISYFDPTCHKIKLFIHEDLLKYIWDNSLKGGLDSIQGKSIKVDDYFNVKTIQRNKQFIWEDIEFRVIQSIHFMSGYTLAPSFGLMIFDKKINKKIFFTGDTQFNPNQIHDFYKEADLIFQDCETSPYASGVHAHYNELSLLDKSIKEKMMLMHYQDNVVDDFDAFQKKAKENNFLGFTKKSELIKF